MDSGLPDKIPDHLDATQSTQPIGTGGAKTPTGSDFQEYMNAPVQSGPQAISGQQQPGVSPYDLVKGQPSQMTQPTMDSIQQQMNSSSNTLNQVHSQLNTKNLKLKQSQKYLLRNKLSEASTNIRTAATKAGVDTGPAPTMTAKQNPIRRYLAYVSDSQNQIAQVQSKMKEIAGQGGTLSPGELLLIQVKMNKAQQALEYSSVLLGKAVDDIKMLFNVQI